MSPIQGKTLAQSHTKSDTYGSWLLSQRVLLGWGCQGSVAQLRRGVRSRTRPQEALGFAPPQRQGLKPHPCRKPLGLPSHVLLGDCHPGTPAWPSSTFWAGPVFLLPRAFKPLCCCSSLTHCSLGQFSLIHPVVY